MSLNPDIRDQAYQFFIEEAHELLQVLENGLLNLKQDYSTPKIHELMRAAHSIKGGAASVELDGIKTLAHRLEDFFKALYSDQVDYDSELESLLLQAYDCLRNPLTEQMEQGSFDEEFALANAQPIFLQLEERLADALKAADNYIPSSTDLGIDIVYSIFEVDVAQSLERLTQVVANPQNYEVAGELHAQAEVFVGFAQLLNLSGFGEIAQTAINALELHPEKALEILQVMLADCQSAQATVLAGDRDRGGEPSAALLAFAQPGALDSQASEPAIATDVPSLDDLFGATFDAPLPNILDAEVSFDDAPSLDDVFGSDLEPAALEPQTIEPLSDVESLSEVEPILDDVFGTFVDSPDNSLSLDFSVSETDLVSSLDDVFGTFKKIESASVPTSELLNETEPSLDDVFGNIADIPELNFPAVDIEILPTENNQDSDAVAETTTFIQPEELPQPENLEAAVDSIDEIFDQLPSLADNPGTLSIQATANSSQKSQKKKSKSSSLSNKVGGTTNLTMKVDLARLERMNNLIGELVINRNSLSLQNKQLQTNVRELVGKFSRFRQVTVKLRELSDQMLIESERGSRDSKYSSLKELKLLGIPGLSQNQEQVESTNIRQTEFDSLEMDNYSQLHSALQGVLEELMQLEESVDDIVLFARQSDRTVEQQRQMLGQMRDELMWARMLPLEQILQRFPRVLRDLCNQYGKSVNLNLIGTGVLVDKVVLEKLYDPLLHLLRNAFDHGIELPQIRSQQNKPEQGQITIHAYYQGNQTIIEVKDDGQGINLTQIAQKAVKKGLISPQQAAKANRDDLFDLIFEPGFSTANQVSEISGRGVGMNVVRSQLEALKGIVKVASTVGQGTTFTLCLPLTLTIAKLLVCSLGSTALAFPSDSIEEIIIPTAEQIQLSNRQRFLIWKQKLVPIYHLGDLLEYNCTLPPERINNKTFETVASPKDWALPLLLLSQGQQLYALEVERLVTEQELVIKPFGKALAAPKYTYGCTILGDGTLIPAINGSILLAEILEEEGNLKTDNYSLEPQLDELEVDSILQKENNFDLPKTNKIAQKTQTILVVDDSAALRRTMALSLEKQGYRVLQARDGREALEQLQTSINIDLVVCDIEMPNMNGFEFLTMRRRDSQLTQIPVIMLTSRSGDKHRNLAFQLGADQYFTKPYIEQEFLREIKKILNTEKRDSSGKTATKTQQTRKTIVLIVDDSSALRRTMALSLENRGYRVLQARDGQEALEQLRKHSEVNLVICDLEMPNMNGFEFLTSRRQEPNLAQIPVAMLTSRNSEKHRSLAKQLGAVAYFTKPYIEEEFFQEISKLI